MNEQQNRFGLTQLFDTENIWIFSSERLCGITQSE